MKVSEFFHSCKYSDRSNFNSFKKASQDDIIHLLNEWEISGDPDTSNIPLNHDVNLIISLCQCCTCDEKVYERFVHVFRRVAQEDGKSSPFLPLLITSFQQRFPQRDINFF